MGIKDTSRNNAIMQDKGKGLNAVRRAGLNVLMHAKLAHRVADHLLDCYTPNGSNFGAGRTKAGILASWHICLLPSAFGSSLLRDPARSG